MVIHSEFLDSLTPSAIRSITAKIRDMLSPLQADSPARNFSRWRT